MLLRWTPQLVLVLAAAAALWAVTLSRSRDMGGTMDMDPMGFGVMWAMMMGAMMLPSVAPVASMYARSVQSARAVRLTAFVLGYLAVWAVSAIPAWAVLRFAGEAMGSGRSSTAVASVVFSTVGVWQLTPLKQRCLRHCRSPLAQLLRYGSFAGPLRDVRVAVHHGLYCLGCCWALMTVLVVTGAMNLLAMVALSGVVAAEKLWRRGELLAVVTGLVALLAGVGVWWIPQLAPGLR